jgi:hypothetical protein
MEKASIVFTNEKLSRRFKSPFELVNYAIHLAEDRIRAGRDIHEISNENLVVSVVKDLAVGKEHLMPVLIVKEKVEIVKAERSHEFVNDVVSEKPKKGKRKIIRDDDEA